MSKAQRLLAFTLAFVVIMSTGIAFADHTATSEGVVGGFEIDGDFDFPPPGTPLTGATRDWENVGDVTRITDPPEAPGSDRIFTNGSKEEQPNNWAFANQKPPSKADITRAYFASEETANSSLIWLGFERLDASGKGDVHANFELNQKNTTIVNSKGTIIPERSDEDLLVVYDYAGGSGPVITEVREWDGATDNPATPQNEEALFGSWVLASPPPNAARGDINGAVVTRPSDPPFGGGTVAAKRFGEVGLDLKQIFGTGFSMCPGGFLQFSVKSRSSGESFTAALKDFVGPASVTTCPTPKPSTVKSVRNVTQNGTFAQTANAFPGETLEYRIVYSNALADSAPATNVTVEDTIQGPQTYVTNSCTGGTSCSESGGKVTWNLGTVDPGESETMTFRVTLSNSFANGTHTVKNAAVAKSPDHPDNPSNETTVTVKAGATPSTVKSVRNVTENTAFAGSTSASPGDTIEYRIVYSTSSDSAPATNVTVEDTIQSGQTYVAASCTGGTSCSESGGKVTWNLGTVQPGGSSTLTFQVLLASSFPKGTTTIKNVAISKSPQHDPQTSNETTVSVTAAPAPSTLKAVRNVTDDGAFDETASADPGDVLEYRIIYSNGGDAPATNVTVEDTIQAGQTYVALSCTGGTSCSESGGTVTWNVGTVNPGDSVTLTFRVTLNASFPNGTTDVKNTAVSKSPDHDPNTSNETTVTVTAAPDPDADKAVRNVTDNGSFAETASAEPGDTLEYQIIYSNNGNAPATNVTVEDTIESGQAYVANSCTGGTSCSESGGKVTWIVGTVNPGGSVTLTFRVVLSSTFPTGTTEVKNTAIAKSPDHPDKPSNTTTVTVTAGPDLELVKNANGTEFSPGQQITYTFTYVNTGNAPATGVVISDEIPEGTEFVSCSDDCTNNDGSVVWDIGTVAAGGGGFVTLTVTLLDSADCQICNIAQIASPDQNAGQPIDSNEECIDRIAGGTPTASASAFGISADILGQTIPEQPTTSDGDETNDTLLAVPADPAANAQLLTVSASDPQVDDTNAHSSATATTADVKLLKVGTTPEWEWLVTAKAVQAVSTSDASGATTGSSYAGSTLVDVTVAGQNLGTVTQPTTVNVVVPAVGTFTVKLLETIDTGTNDPNATQPAGGMWSSGLEVNGIHVTTTLANVVREVIVAHAESAASFPDAAGCGAAHPRVSGEAFSLQLNADENVLDDQDQLAFGEVGRVVLPSTGSPASDPDGIDSTLAHVGPLTVDNGNSTLAESNAAFNHTEGCIETACPAGTTAHALTTSQIEELRLFDQDPDPAALNFLITADAVAARAESTLAGGTATSTGSTTIANLVINGTELCTTLGLDDVQGDNICTPLPNTVLLGIPQTVIVLNEQVEGSGEDASSMTVNAIHIYALGAGNPLGLPANSDIIISHAHSDVVGAGSLGFSNFVKPDGGTVIELPLIPEPEPEASGATPARPAPAPAPAPAPLPGARIPEPVSVPEDHNSPAAEHEPAKEPSGAPSLSDTVDDLLSV